MSNAVNLHRASTKEASLKMPLRGLDSIFASILPHYRPVEVGLVLPPSRQTSERVVRRSLMKNVKEHVLKRVLGQRYLSAT